MLRVLMLVLRKPTLRLRKRTDLDSALFRVKEDRREGDWEFPYPGNASERIAGNATEASARDNKG